MDAQKLTLLLNIVGRDMHSLVVILLASVSRRVPMLSVRKKNEENTSEVRRDRINSLFKPGHLQLSNGSMNMYMR
jgi:hypothetical protein